MNENTILDVGGDAHIVPRVHFHSNDFFLQCGRAIVTLKL